MSSSQSHSPQRLDIQWLRAMAVIFVVVYHLSPGILSGGYVGVDIFFVISGFLITSGLIKKPPKSFHDLAEFWGRRIRRLLPAAFVTIVISSVIACFVAPTTLWKATARSAFYSALYTENWNLWHHGIDYLSTQDDPPLFQHFWSLSVEEQFYVFWPVVILLAVAASSRFCKANGSKTPLAIAIALICAASLFSSALLTPTQPVAGYFQTETRVWELGLGGLLAMYLPQVRQVVGKRVWLHWMLLFASIGAMAASSTVLSDTTPFPGTIALLPTLGCVLFLAAGVPPLQETSAFESPSLALLARIWAFRPIVYIGDISYSIYLWHWPVKILMEWSFERPLLWFEKLLAALITLILSAVSYRFIESTLRGMHPLGEPLKRSFFFAFAGMLIISLFSGSAYVGIGWLTQRELTQGRLEVSQTPCAGAAVYLDPACKTATMNPQNKDLLIPPLSAIEDRSFLYAESCLFRPGAPSNTSICSIGRSQADHSVILFGNSHAVQWEPALSVLSDSLNFHLIPYVASYCYPTQIHPGPFDHPEYEEICLQWSEDSVRKIVELHPDIVVITSLTNDKDNKEAVRTSYKAIIETFVQQGIKVLVLHDTPYPGFDIPTCLAEHRSALSACDGEKSMWVPDDPLADVASSMFSPLVKVLDLTYLFCPTETCNAAIGEVIVYFDRSHVSASFARTAAPAIAPSLSELLNAAE